MEEDGQEVPQDAGFKPKTWLLSGHGASSWLRGHQDTSGEVNPKTRLLVGH